MARTQLKIATCNLYNLNEPGLRMYRDANGWEQDDYDKKIDWTAMQMLCIQADVFGFQELWHQDSLENVFNHSGLSDDYTLLTPPNQDGGNIVCAAAVKTNLLIGDPKWIVNFPEHINLDSKGDDPQTPDISVKINSFSRPLLHFKIKPRSKGKIINVFVCHLKSKRPTYVGREPWYERNKHNLHQEAIALPYLLSDERQRQLHLE